MVLPLEMVKVGLIEELITIEGVEIVSETKEGPGWYQSEDKFIPRKETSFERFPSLTSLFKQFPITIDKQVEWYWINYRVDFEMHTQPVEEPSQDVLLSEKEVQCNKDQ